MTHKEFFDWLRSMQDSNRLSQDMVNGANELLAFIEPEKLKESLSKVNGWKGKNTYMTLSEKGFELIGEFEAFRSKPYRDIANVPTIGFGSTYYPNGKKVSMSDKPITRAEAVTIKTHIINQDFAPAVNLALADEIDKGLITQNMFDALVSLAYNIGTAGFANSSVVRNIRSGNIQKAADAFLLWNKARDPKTKRLKPINGLTRRRQKERKLFLA